MSAPGWYDDPWFEDQLRWWDGRAWTAQVAHRSSVPAHRAPTSVPTLPLAAAAGGLAVVAVALVGSRLLLDWLAGLGWPVAVYVVIGGLLGYGPVLLWCGVVVHRWGGGHWGLALGARGRGIDAAWGPLTWLGCLAAQVVAAVAVVSLGVPFEGNTEGLDSASGERGYVLALAILAVVAAPVVEELLFRGVVLRGLCSVTTPARAVAAQALLFGLVHVDPVRGAGNLGLVIVLGAVGAVLGASALLVGRLAPAMIAHAMVNTVALVVALTGLAG